MELMMQDDEAIESPTSSTEHYEQSVHEFVTNTLKLNLPLVSQLGGHSKARTHRNAVGKNVGWELVDALWKKIKKLTIDEENSEQPRFVFLPGANVDEILMSKEEGTKHVIGVAVSEDAGDVLLDLEQADGEETSQEFLDREMDIATDFANVDLEGKEPLQVIREYIVHCNSIILATGGFGYNEEMIRLYSQPDNKYGGVSLDQYPTTNS